MALHAYLVENLLEALQPPIILVTTCLNLRRTAPNLAAILAGPLTTSPSFVAFTTLLYVTHVIVHVSPPHVHKLPLALPRTTMSLSRSLAARVGMQPARTLALGLHTYRGGPC